MAHGTLKEIDMTVGELIHLLKDLPEDYEVSLEELNRVFIKAKFKELYGETEEAKI